MPDPRLQPQQKAALCNYLIEEFQAQTVILFGSAAKEQMRPDSDVDIAFLSQFSTPSAYDLFMASSKLADLVHREVDLIYFPQANPVFKAQIIATGEILFDSEPLIRQTAFMYALKEYALLNEERHVIMDSYRRMRT